MSLLAAFFLVHVQFVTFDEKFRLSPLICRKCSSSQGEGGGGGVLPYMSYIGTVCAAVKVMVFKQFTLG